MSYMKGEQLAKDELADIYSKLILFYETEIKDSSVTADARKRIFKDVKVKHSIDFKSFENVTLLASHSSEHVELENKSILWFFNKNHNHILSILYHFRNAAAHADIKRVKIKREVWFDFNHKYNNQLKLKCRMKKKDFWEFIEEAKKCTKPATEKRTENVTEQS